MDQRAFADHAAAEGYGPLENRTLPANFVFGEHVHMDDLLIYVTRGTYIVDYQGERCLMGPGEMHYVRPRIQHTEAAGPEGAEYQTTWRAAKPSS